MSGTANAQNGESDLDTLLREREALVRHKIACQGELGDAQMEAFMVTLSATVGVMALAALSGVVLNSYFGGIGIAIGFAIAAAGFVACWFVWRHVLAREAPAEEARKHRLAQAEMAVAAIDARIAVNRGDYSPP